MNSGKIQQAPPPAAPRLTVGQVIEHLFAAGASFQEVRSAMRDRFGVSLQYTGADRVGGRAQQRRWKRIQIGQLAAGLCGGCGAPLSVGNTIGLCPVCLEKKWSD